MRKEFLQWSFLVLVQIRPSSSQWSQDAYVDTTYPSMTDRKVLNVDHVTYVSGQNHLMVVDRSNKSYVLVELPANKGAAEACRLFSAASTCHNFINVLENYDSDKLLLCGTNAGSPTCLYVSKSTLKTNDTNYSISSSALPNSQQGVISLLLETDTREKQLFVGSCQTGKCKLARYLNHDLQSFDSSKDWFDSPTFLNIYNSPKKDLVYAFYRDSSAAFVNDGFTATGQTSEYGMVARVCEADTGGAVMRMRTWMTFARARLLCPYPGQSATGSDNLYYNVLKSTAEIGDVVYGLFVLPSSWQLQYSAVCAYSLSDIDRYMNGQVFPGNVTQFYDSSQPFLNSTLTGGDLSPGQCPAEGFFTNSSATATYENFVTKKTLIRQAISPIMNRPIYIHDGHQFNFVSAMEKSGYHLVYLLKSDGFMQKVRIDPSDYSSQTLLTVFAVEDIVGLVTAFSSAHNALVIVTPSQVVTTPVSDCASYRSCSECIEDPHCGWNVDDVTFDCVEGGNDNGMQTCPGIPARPTNLSVVSGDQFVISWQTASSLPQPTGFLLRISRIGDSGVLLHQKVDRSPFTVPLSETWDDGSAYLLTLWSVNDISLDLDDPSSFIFQKKVTSDATRSPCTIGGNVATQNNDVIVTQDEATQDIVTTQSNIVIEAQMATEGNKDSEGPYMWAFIGASAALIIVISVIMQNHMAIGCKTRTIKTGNGRIFTRRLGLFWIGEKAVQEETKVNKDNRQVSMASSESSKF